jgi:hypothetical protein
MNPPGLTDPQWKAPAEDGGMLLWPHVDQLLQNTADNNRRLIRADGIPIQNVPLSALRAAQRKWVGHGDDERPLIVAAHQTELCHPGVWVKNVLIDALAQRLNGAAHHYAVDTDAPKHLHLRWPEQVVPITDDANLLSAAWVALLDAPTPAHLDHVDSIASRDPSFDYDPALFQFLSICRRLSLELTNLPAMLTNASHQLDWELGLRHHALLASPLWSSEPYLVLVHHVLARAEAFASDYNGCLAAYQIAHRIRSPGRPMPDLRLNPDSCEVPFWLDRLEHGRRQRAMVVRRGGKWCIQLSINEEFVLNPEEEGYTAARRLLRWLTGHRVRLSPRALFLTLFLRLLLADQFVHGIGGGRYDQVTDLLIHRHFGLEPPRFAVTTATLFHPLALQRERVCLPCLQQEGHRLRHNILGEQKLKLVKEIDQLPRFSPRRRELYQQMHRQLTAATGHPRLKQWQQQYEQSLERWREEQTLFDRELFYALQPRERLLQLIDRIRQEIS